MKRWVVSGLLYFGAALVLWGCSGTSPNTVDASTIDAVDIQVLTDTQAPVEDSPDTQAQTEDQTSAEPQVPDTSDMTSGDADDTTTPPDTVCSPDCGSRTCGDDGCGGSCGTCGPHTTCKSGRCEGTCAESCGLYNPDAACQCNPSCVAFGDCCSDACDVCEAELAEPCAPCVPQCAGQFCGDDDGCGGLCSACPQGSQTSCVDGVCVNASYSCAGKCGQSDPSAPCRCDAGCFDQGNCCSDICSACEATFPTDCACEKTCEKLSCGPDGCGGSCGACPEGKYCSDGGCVDDTSGCNGVGIQGCCNDGHLILCDEGVWAVEDCEGLCGWDGNWAGGFFAGHYQCGFLGGDPSGLNPLACDAVCTPKCDKKTCGDNGCGYVCGTCAEGELCEEGQCVPKLLCHQPVGDLVPPAEAEIEELLTVDALDEIPGDLEPTVYGSLAEGNVCAPNCAYPLAFHQLELYFLSDSKIEVFLDLRQLNPAGTGYRLLRHVTYVGGPSVVGYHFENLGIGSTESYMTDALLDKIDDLADQAGDYALPCDADACLEDVEYSYVETFFFGCDVDRYHVVFEQWLDVGIVNEVTFVLDSDLKILEVGGGIDP